MEYIFLEGACLCEAKAAQIYLAKKLSAPPYYGCNLDALYDVATTFCRDVTIVLYGDISADYAVRVWQVLQDAAAETPRLHVAQWQAARA